MGPLLLAAFVTRRLARMVPLSDFLALLRALGKDERVPRSSKMLVGGALLWVASPIDLIPEFIPVLGPLDDILVVTLVLRHLVRTAGPDVVVEHWRGDPRALAMLLRIAGVRTGQ